MELLVAADLVPTSLNIELFNRADLKSLLGEELLSIWNSADARIFNLETPLVDQINSIDKNGPNLIAPKSTINGIKQLNSSLITLANNHILDQGEQGLFSTQDILRENKIPFIGAGRNLSEASKPYIFDVEGKKVGIYACAEHEFSIATKESAGANPFDSLESLDQIKSLKEICDDVIVLYHGGKEHYRYPSPYLQKVCRKMADKGADFIVCQHSHCIGCMEEYQKSTIIYGQGNFIFNKPDNKYRSRDSSILVKLSLGKNTNIQYIPIVQEGKGIRLASEKESEEILVSFYRRSREVLQEGFIEEQYSHFAEEKIESYLRSLSGYGRWLSRFDRYFLKGFMLKHQYNKRRLLAIRNYIECEAHRELFLRGLSETLRNKNNSGG